MRAVIVLSASALLVSAVLAPADAKCSRKGGKACKAAVTRSAVPPAAKAVAPAQPKSPKPQQVISPVS